MKSVALFAVAAFLFQAGHSHAFSLGGGGGGGIGGKAHIIGGAEAPPHAYPYHVFLRMETTRPWPSFCGGSMISPEWVLTAAHCFVKTHFRSTASFGLHDRDDWPALEREALEVTQHPLFNPATLANDIALVKVSPVKLVDGVISPIRLPSQSQTNQTFSGWPVTITGFGYIKKGGPFSYVLRHMSTQVSTFCCGSPEVDNVFSDDVICADGTQYKTISQGDSGGPMVTKEEDGEYTLIGVASFTLMEVCDDLYPSGFTRVASYLDWIHAETGLKPRL